MSWRAAERAYNDDVIGDDPIPRLIDERANHHADRVAQRYKGGISDRSLTPEVVPEPPTGEFGDLTYGEFQHIIQRLAAGFRAVGLESGDRVGIHAATRMEWALSDLAILSAGGVVTTLYERSSADKIQYLLDDAGAIGVLVEDAEKLQRLRTVADDLSLAFVVTIENVDTDDDDLPVISLREVYDRGAEQFDRETYDSWLDDIDPEDLASIVYTSGTTGRPKGVELTHANLRSNLNQIWKRYGPRPDKVDVPYLSEETRSVSFLPLAHIFERTAGHFTMFAAGACVAYAESPDTLQEDFQLVRPTVATSVPRVYEKIYAAIREQASESSVKERIFHWAVGVGQQYHRADAPGVGLRLKRKIANLLVFSKVKSGLGGNIEMLISGGGDLSPDLCSLYHGMGLPIFEGYGLTETSPVITGNPTEEPRIGTIGPPVVDMEISIDESVVPDAEFTTGTVGELVVRGPNVARGYWQLPEKTAAAFSEDGWFRTGDIVRERDDDYLEFIERVKDVFVLSTGKNVAPGPIEDGFVADEVVDQCMVIGDREKFVGALIVPNQEALESWAAEEGIDLPDDAEARCEDERVRERIQSSVDDVNEGFEDYQTIKQFELIPVEFTEDNELLTPTMKMKREMIENRYQDRIDRIYAEE